MAKEELETTEAPVAEVNQALARKATYEVSAEGGVSTDQGFFAKGDKVELDHDGSIALLNEGSIKEATQ